MTDPVDWELKRTRARRHLEMLRSEYQQPGVTIQLEVIEGLPGKAIPDWVDKHNVDLTVLASHGARGWTEWQLASTARKLLEGVPGSVLLVPAGGEPSAVERGAVFGRVLVLLDGSTRAECALPLACRIARAHGAELLLLHVVAPPEPPCPGVLHADELDLDQRVLDRNVRAAQAYMKQVEQRLGNEALLVRSHVSVNREVRDEILRRIDADDVDLAIFSGHARGGRAQHPLGSVAAFVVEHARTPMFVVRDPADSAGRERRAALVHSGVRLPHGHE